MRTSRAIQTLLVLALVLVTLLSFTACKEKEPVSVVTPTTPPPESPPSWKPEAATPTVDVTSSATYWNGQGVMKRIHFDTNKYELLPESRTILKQNASWLLAHPQFRVAIEGHCDERNTEAYNLALGERRANAAKEYLVGLGVPGAKIQTVSYGKSRPLCFDHMESCWQQNRRDEFLLQDAK
jgi:peptidoglycan-associated lipoprotein